MVQRSHAWGKSVAVCTWVLLVMGDMGEPPGSD